MPYHTIVVSSFGELSKVLASLEKLRRRDEIQGVRMVLIRRCVLIHFRGMVPVKLKCDLAQRRFKNNGRHAQTKAAVPNKHMLRLLQRCSRLSIPLLARAASNYAPSKDPTNSMLLNKLPALAQQPSFGLSSRSIQILDKPRDFYTTLIVCKNLSTFLRMSH